MTTTFGTQVSRRRLLGTAAAGLAAAALQPMLAGRLLAAGAGHMRVLHPTPANLLLWSVTYLAEDMGFYADEGLTVERIGLNGGPAAMTALIAGEGEAELATPGEALSAVAQGQDVRILESYTSSDAYTFCVSKGFAETHGVTADSPLDARVAALAAGKGGRFGVTAPGSATDLTARMAVRQAGLDPDSDVQLLPLGTIINVISGIAQGAVDGGALLSPFTEQAMLEFGLVPLLSVANGDMPAASRLQGQVLHAPGALVESRAADYAAFVRADLRALKLLHDDPDTARDKLRETRFDKLDAAVWPSVWAGQLPTFATPYVAAEGLRAWIETGTIGGNPDPATFPYDRMIDMRFVEAGLKDLGWTM